MDNYYRKFMKTLIQEDFKDCVMAEVPVESNAKDPYPVLPQILSYIESIPDDIVYTGEDDMGKEEWPHITILYGLEDDQQSEVKEILDGLDGKIKVKLGKISKFRHEDFDVLKIDVISKDLAKINEVLKTLSNENEYPTYIPHVTLAYVNKDEGEEFVGDDTFDGIEVIIEKIVYADKDRGHKNVLGEMSGWGGGGAGYGGAMGGSISAAGMFGTYGGTGQNLNKFGKSSRFTTHDIANSPVGGTEGNRSLPQNGNIVMGWSPYDSIKPEDLLIPGMDKDELYMGIEKEMSIQVHPDKNIARERAIANIVKDPKYYSSLKMYMSESRVSFDDRVSAVNDIIKDLQSKRNKTSSAINHPANEMIQSAIKSRSSGRSIESISEIMRDMYNAESQKKQQNLKDKNK